MDSQEAFVTILHTEQKPAGLLPVCSGFFGALDSAKSACYYEKFDTVHQECLEQALLALLVHYIKLLIMRDVRMHHRSSP